MPPVLRYAGFGNEATFGTEVPATFHVDIQSASLDAPSGTETYYQGGIGRGLRTRRPGFYAPSGNIVYGWDIRTIAAMLRWALGGYKFGAGSPNLHEIWGSVDTILPSYTARIGKDLFEHVFGGCVTDKFELDLAADILQATSDIVARRDSKATIQDEEDLLLPDEFPLAFHEVTAVLNGDNSGGDVSANIRALKLTIVNGVSADKGRGIGSRFPGRLPASGRDVTLGMDLYYESTDHLEAFWGGATGPSDTGADDLSLAIAATAGADGELSLNLPSVHFSKAALQGSGRDEIVQSCELRAMVSDITLDDGVTDVRSEILASVLNDATNLEA
jgi:hypothetical protein